MIEILGLVLLSLGNKSLKYIFIERFLIKRSLSTFKGPSLVLKYKLGFIRCALVDFSLLWTRLGDDNIRCHHHIVWHCFLVAPNKHPLTLVKGVLSRFTLSLWTSSRQLCWTLIHLESSTSLRMSLSNHAAYRCLWRERPNESGQFRGLPRVIMLFTSLSLRIFPVGWNVFTSSQNIQVFHLLLTSFFFFTINTLLF